MSLLRSFRERPDRLLPTAKSESAGHDAAGDPAAEIARLQERVRSLESALAEARRIDERKDEFMAMLGHELRNPLAAVLLALQLMQMRQDSATERERIVVERQARHMMQLIDDLLDMSRVARGSLELRKEPIELSAVVARAVEMTSPVYAEKRHALRLDVPEEGLTVDADPMRLGQVFANLLSNAAKYTDPGGRVDVVARREGGCATVTIRDSGVGIDPRLLSQVFDPFMRAEEARARAGSGLGLGLAIVRMIVHLHGGLVTAQSEGAGTGSTFVVRLPALP